MGLGWNIAYVGATATLADAAGPAERGRVMAAMDSSAIGTAALGSIVGTGVLGLAGIEPLVIVCVLVTLMPIPLLRADAARRGLGAAQGVEK